MSVEPDLASFLARLPWLADVGLERLDRLDRSDWYLPSEATRAQLEPVGEAMGAHLMFYRRDAGAVPNGLCTTVEAAPLCNLGLDGLTGVEAEQTEYVIVAYRSPVRLRGGGVARPPVGR